MEISKLSSAAFLALALTGLGACSSDPAKPDDSSGAQQTSSAETGSGMDSTATGTTGSSSTTTGEFAQMETSEPATVDTTTSSDQSTEFERSQRK